MDKFIQYVIYWNPSDFPGMFVVRRWSILPGQAIPDKLPYLLGMDLDSIRAPLQKMGLVFLARHPSDDPVIIET